MGAPHCFMCGLSGYRTCDLCGGVVFDPVDGQVDVCGDCLPVRPARMSGAPKAPRHRDLPGAATGGRSH